MSGEQRGSSGSSRGTVLIFLDAPVLIFLDAPPWLSNIGQPEPLEEGVGLLLDSHPGVLPALLPFCILAIKDPLQDLSRKVTVTRAQLQPAELQHCPAASGSVPTLLLSHLPLKTQYKCKKNNNSIESTWIRERGRAAALCWTTQGRDLGLLLGEAACRKTMQQCPPSPGQERLPSSQPKRDDVSTACRGKGDPAAQKPEMNSVCGRQGGILGEPGERSCELDRNLCTRRSGFFAGQSTNTSNPNA